MNFLNPALLFGLFGAALPVVVHLLGRRHGRRVDFAAMDFLLASEKRLAARRRLRDLLLLLARASLLGLAAFILARPLVAGARVAGSGMPVSAVLVIDRSASMTALAHGASAFERGRELLLRALAELPSGSEAALVSLERKPRRLSPGFVAPVEIARLLKELEPGATAGRATPALAEALALLPGAHRGLKTVLVASDLQRFAWDDPSIAGFDWADARVVVLDAAPRGFEENAGLVAALPGKGPAAELAVEAHRSGGSGDAAIAESLVVLEGEGSALNRSLLRFDAEGRGGSVLALPAAVPFGVESWVRIEKGGSLAADDRRFLWLEPGAPIRVLLGDGAPDADLYRDELFYLERALAAAPDRFRPRLVDASQGRLGPLAATDVVVLANVERLLPTEVEPLRQFVEQGGGLLIAAGDRSLPEALERSLGTLLPGRPRAVSAARAGEPPIGIAAPASPPHVVALPFDDAVSIEVLAGTRVQRWIALEPERSSEVVLSLTNSIPLLVVGRRERGRVAFLATSIDRDWSTLPVRPTYLPLLSRTLAWVAGRLERPRVHAVHAGDDVAVLPEEGRVPVFQGPTGELLRPLEPRPGEWMLEEVTALGPHRALVDGRRLPALDFVVNVDPAETDLERIEIARLEAWMGQGSVASEGERSALGSETRAALPLLALLVLAFGAEAVLGGRAARRAAMSAEPE